MTPAEKRRYGLIYVVVYIILWAIGTAFFLAFPAWKTSGGLLGVPIGAASFTYSKFVKSNRRLPYSREYWTLVLFSTALAVLLEAAMTVFSIKISSLPMPTANFWTFILAIVAVTSLAMNMISYSKFLGRMYFKKILNAEADRR